VGFRSKRVTKKLPTLMEDLEFLRTSLATLGASGKLDADQMSGLKTLAPTLDTMIDEGNAYLAEYRAAGDVSDPGLGEWFEHAQAFLVVGRDRVNRLRHKMLAGAAGYD
jgi:hypothetical protein